MLGGPFTSPLSTIIASQRAALSCVSSPPGDGIGRPNGDEIASREPSEVDALEEFRDWPLDQMRPHPGLVSQRANVPSLLYERPYSRHSCAPRGAMPSDSLTSLPLLWGSDHDSAETQVRSCPWCGVARGAELPVVRSCPWCGLARGADLPAVRSCPWCGLARGAELPVVRTCPRCGVARGADLPAVRSCP
jgi:hypothetical protein